MTTTTFKTPAQLDAANSTILAALRHYQATAYAADGSLNLSPGLHDIATNGGRHLELDADSVNALCQAINTGALNLRGG